MNSSPLPTELERLPSLLEQEIQSFFYRQKERYEYGDLFEPIFFDMCEFVGRKGKRIRPLLFLLTYRALGGAKAVEDKSLVQAALSLELLHAFVLVHDDLIDRSEKRRGLPTFHKLVEQRQGRLSNAERTGQGVALVVGDLLFALSVEVLQQSSFAAEPRQKALGKLLSYVTDTGVGEIFDILLGSRDIGRVSREDIERTYLLKTTRYTFEAPCVMGAILAGASAEKAEDLAKVMEPLGLAFQIQNDLLEFSHFDSKDALLPTDLLEGKKTLLIREAYDRLGEVDRSFLQMCLQASTRNESSISKVQDLLRKSGAIQAMQERCATLFQEANQHLAESHLSLGEQESITQAIGWIRQSVRLGASRLGQSLLPSLSVSYRAAQSITREHARTFYFSSHVLSAEVRRDAYAVYACCRSVDDAIDGAAARGEVVRPEVAGEILGRAFGEGGAKAGEEWMPAFRHTVDRKKIQRRWFEDLAVGVAGDAGPVDLQTWKELDLYCYRVAGTVGLMMMRVFGSEKEEAEPRAVDLGRGMQLTNILRDVAEDARAGRIYLPAEERKEYGVRREDLLAGRPSGRWAEFMRFQVARTREQYVLAEPGIAMLPAGGGRCSTWLMRELYAGILDPIEASGYDVFSKRHSLPIGQKLVRGMRVILRSCWS